MPHFVEDPVPANYWEPRVGQILINSKSGSANINVYYPGTDRISVRVQSDHPRFRINVRGGPTKPGLRLYTATGLVANDSIAVFDGAGRQQTEWLRIAGVASDEWNTARVLRAGLPVSQHKPNISFDPYGTSTSSVPVSAEKWIAATEKAIANLLANPVGKLILDAVTGKVVIFYDKTAADMGAVNYPSSDPSDAKVMITPADFPGSLRPGDTYEETIIHELAHTVDGRYGAYFDYLPDGLKFDDGDFFTITVTNVFASTKKRPLRKDHKGLKPMPALYLGPAGEAKFNKNHQINLGIVRRLVPDLYRKLIFVDAPWNPFG